ncbi:acyl carrier protein [Coprobacter tertius]|uniref:Acyl carrier protein n=1 Tax=Coprobacter tertius TaxID=2944915 RepID=A0ABT1MNF4_9BACT|nr:acyl carrier protein [Coprobacter tertius]MCP9612816.1 acyl carrier protein [Coprobacter tertius]
MENYLEQIAELLEEEKVTMEDELKSFDAWDSLTILSIIAFADENYKVTLNAKEINNAQTVGGLKELIDSKREA